MNTVKTAVELLKNGKLVILPTETVYGLACDPHHPQAVERLYRVKDRPKHKALSVLLPNAEAMHDWAIDIPERALTLARQHWPGPLTLVLKKAPHVPEDFTQGKTTIGLRVPDHPFTLAVLKQFGNGVCAPSANFSGAPAPTSFEAIDAKLIEKIDHAFDGGPCPIQKASTIIDLSGDTPVVLREGVIQLGA